MFNRVVTDPQEFPIEYKDRKSTDVFCTIVAAIFAIVLFAIAAFNFNKDQFKVQFFLDQLNPDIAGLKSTDIGGFQTTLLWSALLALSIGLLWMTFTHCFPMHAPLTAHILAIISLIVIGIFSFIVTNTLFTQIPWLKIAIAVIAILLAIILTITLCFYNNEIRFQGVLLKYGVRFLTEYPLNFLYIIFFFLMTAGLVALFLFQHLCFSNIKANANNHNFFDFTNEGFLGYLNIIELFWGLQFIQDAFIFVLSGKAIDWYWQNSQHHQHESSFNRLICKHWGGVVAGSFMNAFLRIPAAIIEQVICHPTSCCNKCGYFCNNSCNWCTSFFGLVRTDTYSYINIFGTPYCDASRECEKICAGAHHFSGFQSPMRNYRSIATIFLIALCFILSYLILRVRVQTISIWFILTLIVTFYIVISFFVSIHASVSEGIQTSFLVEHHLSSGYDYMQNCLPSFRKELQSLANREKRDGQC